MIRRLQPSLHAEEVAAYLEAGPSDRVAFVPAKVATKPLAETLAALANANGGLALLGRDEQGSCAKGERCQRFARCSDSSRAVDGPSSGVAERAGD